MFKGITRTLIFVTCLFVSGSFAWIKVQDNPICPSHMIIPFMSYFFEGLIFQSKKYSMIRSIDQVFGLVDNLKPLSLSPINGGPKFITVYVFMGIFASVSLALVIIPWAPSQVLGLMASLVYTVAFVLNTAQFNFKIVLWPVYANAIACFLGLFITVC